MSQLFLLYSTASSDFEIDKNNNVKSASPEIKTKRQQDFLYCLYEITKLTFRPRQKHQKESPKQKRLK